MSLEPPSNSPSPDQPGKTRESLLKQVIHLKGKCLLVGYRKVFQAHLLGVCKHHLHVCEGHSSRVIPLTLAAFIFAGLKHIFDFCRAGRVSLPLLACLVEFPAPSIGIICPFILVWVNNRIHRNLNSHLIIVAQECSVNGNSSWRLSVFCKTLVCHKHWYHKWSALYWSPIEGFVEIGVQRHWGNVATVAFIVITRHRIFSILLSQFLSLCLLHRKAGNKFLPSLYLPTVAVICILRSPKLFFLLRGLLLKMGIVTWWKLQGFICLLGFLRLMCLLQWVGWGRHDGWSGG